MIEKTNPVSLEALRSGDRDAFARLIEETSSQVYHIALRILGNTQDAEDALQETYIKAFRSLLEFEGRSSLNTWLYRIVVNEALMIIRRQKKVPITMEESEQEEELAEVPLKIVDWQNLPEGELLSNEARHFLDQAVLKLSPGLRVVFVMRDLNHLSIQETAEALGITESSVKTRLSRARLALREELSQYYAERL